MSVEQIMPTKLISDIKEMKQDIIDINIKLDRLIDICSRINITTETTRSSSNKMDEHISLVEGVYSTIRSPMTYIINKVCYISGDECSSELPCIKSD
jgi:hypothetical protein